MLYIQYICPLLAGKEEVQLCIFFFIFMYSLLCLFKI